MGRARAKARQRRLIQKKNLARAKQQKIAWAAKPFKLRTLLCHIGFQNVVILTVWLQFRRDKYPMDQLTNVFLRGYGTRRLRIESMW